MRNPNYKLFSPFHRTSTRAPSSSATTEASPASAAELFGGGLTRAKEGRRIRIADSEETVDSLSTIEASASRVELNAVRDTFYRLFETINKMP